MASKTGNSSFSKLPDPESACGFPVTGRWDVEPMAWAEYMLGRCRAHAEHMLQYLDVRSMELVS